VVIFIIRLGGQVRIQRFTNAWIVQIIAEFFLAVSHFVMRLLSISLFLQEFRRVIASKWVRRTHWSSWNTGYWQVRHDRLRQIEALVAVVLSVHIVAVVNLTLSLVVGKSMSLGNHWFLPDRV